MTKDFFKKHWDKLILAFLVIAYCAVMISLSLARHNAFASRFDLSNMDQTLWYTLNGYFFQLRHPDEFVSRFSIHADLILVILSPLYLIWDDVRMLIASESVFLALGAIPVYLISRKILKSKIISVVLSAIYLLNPGMQWTDIYDFHGVSLFIPFFLFAFYFAIISKWKWYWLFIILALITKENVSLIIALFGLIICFNFRKFRAGAITFIIGLVWFYLMVGVIMPYFTPSGAHWALAGYENDARDPLSGVVLKNLQPQIFTENFILNEDSQAYYLLLLRQYGFLPLFGMPWLILSLPEIFINVIRDTKTLTFHYDSAAIPGLVIASIFGLSYIKILFTKINFTRQLAPYLVLFLSIFALFYALRVNYQYGPLPWTPWCQCYIYNVTEEDIEFEKILQAIPREASVTASLEIRPHVSHRFHAYTLPSATESADFIAIITQNRIISNYEKKDYENKLIPILLKSAKHELKHKSKHFYLFKKKSG